MKHLAVFFLAGALASAADFTNGQAARMVIGQTTFTKQFPTSSDTVLGAASGLAYTNGMLFVADSNRVGATPDNNRVLKFNLPATVRDPTAQPEQGTRCPACTGTADVVLGQTDFNKFGYSLSQTGLRQPTAVATDGSILAVADTDNNRVLIWKSIPTVNAQPADIVLGQPDFNTNLVNPGTGDIRVPSAKTLRGPQGVWIQNGKLFVADTQNHRVLVWNSIPTSNFQAANLVLGQANFSVALEPDLTKALVDAKADNLLNPVSVTSDGVRLYVADLGHSRVLIWNSIPTQNTQPADVVVGQPDMTSAIENNSSALCDSTGTGSDGKPTYPSLCAGTVDFPRFALSDGTRLFVADGGNDRILVFNNIPTQNGTRADIVLGQINDQVNLTSDNANPLGISSSDSFYTPMSLAWDGTNLYVSDPVHRRVLVFTPGGPALPITAVRNAASLDVYAVGNVSFGGTVAEKDEVSITIQGRAYKYTVAKDEGFTEIVNGLASTINSANDGQGDPAVFASPNAVTFIIVLRSRVSGEAGNAVDYTATVSTNSQINVVTSGPTLAGGQDAAKIAPGTVVTILGDKLAETEAGAPADADPMPKELGGVEVYFDGMQAPLFYVSPTQVSAQVPWEVNDTNSISCYVRTKRSDGTVSVSTAVGVPIISANPGLFTDGGSDPRPGVVLHGSSQASGTVSVDGTVTAGDIGTVTINGRSYTYTAVSGDTLETFRDGLIALINQDPEVMAFKAGLFTRIRLRARVEGPEGNGIPFSATASGNTLLTATNSELVGANVAGSRVTEANPAVPGETLIVMGTGLGIVQPDDAKFALFTGFTYKGPTDNNAVVSVSSLAGGKTANVLFAGVQQGGVGVYQVDLELNSDLPTNPTTQLTIAQDIYVSNIITFALWNPRDDQPPATVTVP